MSHIFIVAFMCRICLQSVRRSAVICEECSLIAHARCASEALADCDRLPQISRYSEYPQLNVDQETSKPAGRYSPKALAPVTILDTPEISPQKPHQSEVPILGPPKLLDRLLAPWKRSNKLPE